MSRITTIIFDLGGVLFELSWDSVFSNWTSDQLTPEQLLEKWRVSPAVRRFERGDTDFASFKDEFEKEMGLSWPDEKFEGAFRDIVGGLYPGSRELLSELSERYLLACFSNTNPVHWDVLASRFDILGFFSKIFTSFEMGMVKPERKAFLHVLEGLGCPGDEVVFLDDGQANVRAAVDCGMNARLVKGVRGAREALADMGLL